jgi:glycosyltransferase involved in cell wall biosynthesis
MKKISISLLGNYFYDTRVTNLSASLKSEGCEVKVNSFEWFISGTEYFNDGIKMFRLKKGKISLFFYISFAYKLTRELLKSKEDIYLAEDIYSLPFVTIVGKWKKGKIVYNSRELYAFIGGLKNRPVIQYMVKTIERFFIKRVDLVLTTGEMDSEFLEKFYGISNTLVLRNIPLLNKASQKIDYRKMFNIGPDMVIMLYQGVLLNGRGVKLILNAMVNVPKSVLVLLGEGAQRKNFEDLSRTLNISDRVFFAGAIDQKELINYTAGADFGLAVIENISVSYYHALPNKLFEYIMADLPVLSSDLPQMKKVIEQYDVGVSIDIEHTENLTKILNEWAENPSFLKKYKDNCKAAVKELNWQAEFNKCKERILE